MFTYPTVELLYGTSGARADTGSGWGMQWGGLRKLSSTGGTFSLLPLPCVGVRKYVYTLHEQSVFLTAFLLVPLLLFFKTLLKWTIFKSLLNLLQNCFCFVFWFFSRKAWGSLGSLTMDQNHTPFIGRQNPNHWTVKEVPKLVFKPVMRTYFPGVGLQGRGAQHVGQTLCSSLRPCNSTFLLRFLSGMEVPI